MSFNNNVIDLSAFRKERTSTSNEGGGDGQVVDFVEKRQEILQDERRQVKRTILTEFVGAFIVVPQKGLCEVSLYDISEKGMSFDLDYDKGSLRDGEEIAMRIYMNQHTYFPFSITVSNSRDIQDEGVYRHGASFVKGTVNDEALHHFVKFIENVSSCLQRDNGDIMVSNLGK